MTNSESNSTSDDRPSSGGEIDSVASCSSGGAFGTGVCPVCRAQQLIEIRGKLQCARCHSICETCCEGGRG